MATIYRFIVDEGKSGKSGGRKSGGNSRKKTGKTTTLLKMFETGNKGGVESNRKMRAINPLINRITNGYWEKGVRIGRAGLGLVKFKKNESTGALSFAGLSGSAIAIIIAFAIQVALKHHAKLIERTEKINKQNYKQLENGQSAVHGEYSITQNFWSGKISYKENR